MLHLAQSAVIAGVVVWLAGVWDPGAPSLAPGLIAFAVAYALTKLFYALRYGVYLAEPETDQYGRKHRYWRIKYPPSYWAS